tara:strand:- start:1318 stop:2160 length:843 start_codon:yes stop_codon:yes gene_type:complete
MALRKDQIQSLKDSLCLDNVDPATRSALNNLVDNLIPLFESTAIPDLGDLGGIDSGATTGPGNEDDMLGGTPPLGGGEEMPFDDLGGFEDAPPGGGEPIDDGGGGGVEEPESGPGCLKIFTAKTKTKIPAASDGTPGEGFVIPMVLAPKDPMEGWNPPLLPPENEDPITAQDYFNCREKCRKEVDDNISTLLSTNVFILSDDARKDLKDRGKRDELTMELLADCWAKCNEDLSFQENENGDAFSVYNISCDEIAKDTTVIVSYNWCINQGYVLVEACGCD